jgi:uroporphyrinogen-III synthase
VEKTLIWTRGIDDWQSDHLLLSRVVPEGVHIEHIPCVRLSPVEIPSDVLQALTNDPWDHVVFTSAHGVSFALASPVIRARIKRSSSVYTLGSATAQALARHGIDAIRPEGIRTGEDLGAWLDVHLPKDAHILVPSPRQPAFDLAQYLKDKGRQSLAIVCYETEAKAHLPSGEALSTQNLKELGSRPTTIVCFASPSAVRGFVAGAPGVVPPAVVIGPTTEAAAKQFFTVKKIADENSLESLVKAAVSQLI